MTASTVARDVDPRPPSRAPPKPPHDPSSSDEEEKSLSLSFSSDKDSFEAAIVRERVVSTLPFGRGRRFHLRERVGRGGYSAVFRAVSGELESWTVS